MVIRDGFLPDQLLWRTTPAVLIGGSVLIAYVFRKDPMDDPDRRLPALYLFLWMVIYIVVMSLGAKKFDRYLLPGHSIDRLTRRSGLDGFVSWIVNRWSRPASYLISGGYWRS
jgi:hypothetical protein